MKGKAPASICFCLSKAASSHSTALRWSVKPRASGTLTRAEAWSLRDLERGVKCGASKSLERGDARRVKLKGAGLWESSGM